VWRKQLLSAGEMQRQRERSLSVSEIMTILIHFHQSHYRNFKAYYLEYVLERLRPEFPGLVSYNRFVEFIPSVLVALCVYLRTRCLGTCTGISFIDSTALAVCKNPRIHAHKVFAGLAERGKTSTGWFFGFKLHLVFNDRGELLNLMLTPGNVDDRKPVPKLVRKLFGKLFGDNGLPLSRAAEGGVGCSGGLGSYHFKSVTYVPSLNSLLQIRRPGEANFHRLAEGRVADHEFAFL
jgi:hypothetical protein